MLVMQETLVQSLNWEDPLEKEMSTHSSTLEKEIAIHSSNIAWEIPWTEEFGGLQSMGSQRVEHDLVAKKQHFYKTKLFDLCFK